MQQELKTQNKKIDKIGKLLREGGSTVGGFIGSRFGGSLGGKFGSAVGRGLGAAVSKVTGHGDYRVQYNTVLRPQEPSFNSGRAGTRIRHREFITNISGGTTFSKNDYNINPGLASTFPWLSTVALNFSEYIMHGCIFEFVSSSGSIGVSSPALGVVVLATEYNNLAEEMYSKQAMESHMFASSVVPADNCMHAIECSPLTGGSHVKFIRDTTVPSGGSINNFDVGRTSVGTEGMQSTYVLGELWVTYDVELLTPKLPSTIKYGACRYTGHGTTSSNLSQLAQSWNTFKPFVIDTTGTDNGIALNAPGIYGIAIAWHSTTSSLTGTPALNLTGTGITLAPKSFGSNWNTVGEVAQGGTATDDCLVTGVVTVGSYSAGANYVTITGLTNAGAENDNWATLLVFAIAL
jgi:hypothetical protein